MRNKQPPFETTNKMIHEVAEIAELVGKLTSTNQLSTNPTLRRTNRIRTIHGSLAIEQNTLSLRIPFTASSKDCSVTCLQQNGNNRRLLPFCYPLISKPHYSSALHNSACLFL